MTVQKTPLGIARKFHLRYQNIHIFQNKENYGCNISEILAIKSKGRYISLLDHDDYWLPKRWSFR